MSFELFATQTAVDTVVVYMDGVLPQDPVTVKQYAPATKTFVDIGTLTDFLVENGIEVTGLLAGTTYEWLGVDTVTGDVSNVVRKLIQPTTPTVQFDAQIVKSESAEIPSFTVTATILNAQGVTDKIIVMHRKTDGTDELWCVASPTQISEFAEDAPASGANFFRVNTVTKTFDNVHQARAFVTRLKADLDYLAKAWKEMLEFNFSTEMVTYPID